MDKEERVKIERDIETLVAAMDALSELISLHNSNYTLYDTYRPSELKKKVDGLRTIRASLAMMKSELEEKLEGGASE